ncbi:MULTISPECIES: hypothetical protein [Halobacterium]|uniref:hypothetical protein n=1 Tax=Halobacterium TaxID=2239 RepID=UPI00073F641B|nr:MULTISPECIES: hypothetical protein [Halobacterium]MCG1004877.1 hypothetical protein [Halobacterium noricense]
MAATHDDATHDDSLIDPVRRAFAVVGDKRPEDYACIDLDGYRLTYREDGYWAVIPLDDNEPTDEVVGGFSHTAFSTVGRLRRYLAQLEEQEPTPTTRSPEVH